MGDRAYPACRSASFSRRRITNRSPRAVREKETLSVSTERSGYNKETRFRESRIMPGPVLHFGEIITRDARVAEMTPVGLLICVPRLTRFISVRSHKSAPRTKRCVRANPFATTMILISDFTRHT